MPKTLEDIIKQNLKKGKPRIGFGLIRKDKEVIASLRKGKKYAEIVLVSPKKTGKVAGFKCALSSNPEKKLAEMLYYGEVDGIIRGTVDDFKTFEVYEKLIGKKTAEKMKELAMLEDAYGRRFFISEASNPRGWTTKEKIKAVEDLIEFMKESGMTPKIGVITGVRHGTYRRRKATKTGVVGLLNKTYEQAEQVVKHFKKGGYKIKNYAIELGTAVEDGCNIIVPPCGMAGNQIFRALCRIGGGKILICSRYGLPHPYEDNSRTEKDYEFHIKWLAAWINSKKK